MKNYFTRTKAQQRLSVWRTVSLFTFLCLMGMQSANAQYTAIPDANFEQHLITLGIDSGTLDHQVLTANITGVTYLNVSSESISSLIGIQAFTSLTHLYCGNNQLSTLDVSSLANLLLLNCNYNQLTTLNISNNANLLNLDCRKNNLTSINFSGVSNLTSLACGSNKFSMLNVLNLSGLEYLDCEFYDFDGNGSVGYFSLNSNNNYLLNTPLTSLTLNGLANLVLINSSGNNLTSLNLSGLNSLSVLKSQNNISSINLSGLSNLTYIDLMENPLTSLNISGLNNLATAYLAFTNLTNLDASGLTNLSDLTVQSCPNLISLNVTGCSALVNLNCSFAKLSNLNLTGCSSLQTVQCEDNKLTSLNLSGLTALEKFYCGNYFDVPGSRNQITTINFTGAINLKEIYCDRNLLANLNLSGLINLEYLDCSYNEITSLNLTGLNVLGYLNCSGNTITNLTLSGSTALGGINCTGNQISSLNLSGFANLTELHVESNLLTNLDLRNLTNLTNMSALNNPLLNCISTDDVNVANANSNWTKDSSTSYSTNCSGIPSTKVRASQCGITLATLNSKIAANLVNAAQMYRFEVSNGISFNTIEVNKYNFSLTVIPGITYATTYSIKVAVKIAGVWGVYGQACSVTTPALTVSTIPITRIRSTFCGTTLAALTTKIPALIVYNAEGYRFEITAAGVITVYDSISYNFRLSDAGIVATSGTTYAIRVAAKVAGVYGNYGVSCNVTTPGVAPTSRQMAETTSIETIDFSLMGYPNPSNSTFKLQVNGANDDSLSILVFDMMGRQIENKLVNANDIENISIGQNYSTGIYNVIVSQGMKTKTVRLVKN